MGHALEADDGAELVQLQHLPEHIPLPALGALSRRRHIRQHLSSSSSSALQA